MNSTLEFSQTEIEQIHKTLARFPMGSQLAIARVVSGSPTFYGATKESNGVKFTDNCCSVFDIGSVAKVFTSAILAKLIENKALNLDDSVFDILTSTHHSDTRITLKQLANHTSGLPRIPPKLWRNMFNKKRHNPYAEFDQQKLHSYLRSKIKLNKQGKFGYSNLGAGLLGHSLSVFVERPYESILQDNICQPLGLLSTTTVRESIKDNLVVGLDKKGNPVPYWDLGALLGAGGIYSCVSDLAHFAIANMDEANSFLTLQRKETEVINKKMSVGLGWLIGKQAEPKDDIHFHDGGSGGFTSLIRMNVHSKTAVVILSNISPFHIIKVTAIPKLARTLYRNKID